MDDTGEPPEVPGFELGELLARGGTSEVWAGVGRSDGRRVAVKVAHAALASIEAAAREASVSARAASAHVVSVEACVELADGRLAVVMPHLRGGSLDRLVRARGHLAPGEVVTVLAPVASALGRLHGLGVVHGDVSPGNVLLDLDGRPVLGDLGLGHVLGEVSPGVWGTEGYVAPEVLLGADPSPASDVYALGALGWLCLSGTVPGAPGLRPELADVSLAGTGAEALVRVLDTALDPEATRRPGAHELAWHLFRAAPAQPLDLVREGDELSAVTYRLREAAGRELTADEPRPRRLRAWRGRARQVVRGKGRHARADAAAGSSGRSARRRGRPVGVVVLGSAVVALAMLGVLVLAVAATGRGDGPARARPAGDAGLEVPTSAAAAASDPRSDPLAPRERPTELLASLADARARAWREATAALLHAADAPGSAAAARDAAAVTDLARAGLRFTGLRYTVAEVETVSATTDTAVLRARIDTGAYAVAGASGSTPRPARTGSPVLVDLVRTDVGWRVSALRPAP
ncbi:MAG TPA: serine/threonine-protein kinase [Ornithinibacter sp.]|nr:serine/threonine-protein kinase [Ornithinibacter sp.]